MGSGLLSCWVVIEVAGCVPSLVSKQVPCVLCQVIGLALKDPFGHEDHRLLT